MKYRIGIGRKCPQMVFIDGHDGSLMAQVCNFALYCVLGSADHSDPDVRTLGCSIHPFSVLDVCVFVCVFEYFLVHVYA